MSFAGVDSLDDVKNHTYNELFVSGGFIVSDEFVLNPELITQGTFHLAPRHRLFADVLNRRSARAACPVQIVCRRC